MTEVGKRSGLHSFEQVQFIYTTTVGIPYSGVFSQDKFFVHFVDLLLCTKNVIREYYKVWVKYENTIRFCEIFIHEIC